MRRVFERIVDLSVRHGTPPRADFLSRIKQILRITGNVKTPPFLPQSALKTNLLSILWLLLSLSESRSSYCLLKSAVSVSPALMSTARTSAPPLRITTAKLSPPLPGVAVTEPVQSEFTV